MTEEMSESETRLLVVDDSAVVREAVRRVLGSRPGWSVRAAADAVLALEKIRQESPDVILLDLEMPRLDGLTFLRHIMATEPIPVVVCSGHADHGTQRAAAALELGAVDIFPKPRLAVKEFLEDAGSELAGVLERAAAARVGRVGRGLRNGSAIPPAGDSPQVRRDYDVERSGARLRRPPSVLEPDGPVVLMGASLGGPEALRVVLDEFPEDGPPCVVVQHMLAEFTEAFVGRLDSRVEVSVGMAADGSPLVPGRVLVAPGGRHVRIETGAAGRPVVRVVEGAPVRGHRPSIDVLFESAADRLGDRVVAAILTGMGNDGACGLRALRDAGARTLVQDEGTSIVFGMPSAALALDAAEEILALPEMGKRILALAGGRSLVRPGARGVSGGGRR